MKTKVPFILFTVVLFCFLAGEYYLALIEMNYTFVHFLFGLCGPLLLGYFPSDLFKFNGIYALPFNRGWEWCWKWTFYRAVFITFLISFVNEVIDDPRSNGVPFFDAWHHFAADLAGLAVFFVGWCCVAAAQGRWGRKASL